uniref:hypothetical protein n=1 Tax=Chryseobacterium indologenes TaxID=253 RepID=UPI000B255BAF
HQPCKQEKQSSKTEILTGNEINVKKISENIKAEQQLEQLTRTEFINASFEKDSIKSLIESKPIENVKITRNDLEGMSTFFESYDGAANFGIAVPGFGNMKLGKKESSFSVYYLEHKKMKVDGKDVFVGCGYSVHYLFKQVKTGISATNMAAVAASVQLDGGKTQVYYSMKSYGMVGKDLAKFFKPVFNKDFNVDGFALMQQNVDGIHKLITGEIESNSIKFTPEIITDKGFYQ